LVIDFHGQSAQPIGRCMARGEQVAQPASDALIVLKWSGPGDYYVLTSYPECPK
jgi:hypothetical protein